MYLEVRERATTAPLAIDAQTAALVPVQPKINRAIGEDLDVRGGLPDPRHSP